MAKISIITLGLAASLTALPVLAQSNTGSANYNAGYGRLSGQENRMVDYSTRDANGNRVIVDGVMLTGDDQSTFTRSGGSLDSYSGAGSQGSSTAIGNNLVVITQGSYNTVIVNSTQTNNGDVTANAGTGDDD